MNIDTENKNAAEFHATSDDVFERISSRYDFLCDLFSFGLHRVWKNGVAREINKTDWKILVDGASGTGDIVLRAISNDKSMQDRKIISADLSPSMLNVARKRISHHSDYEHIEFEVMDAENMKSIKDCSVDCFSFSLAAKICNRDSVFNEAFRILKPGGTFVILEASSIPNRLVHLCYLRYMKLCMPIIGWIASGGDSSAYLYLLKGIEDFPTAEELVTELTGYGFESVSFKRYTFGIVALHRASKPLSSHA